MFVEGEGLCHPLNTCSSWRICSCTNYYSDIKFDGGEGGWGGIYLFLGHRPKSFPTTTCLALLWYFHKSTWIFFFGDNINLTLFMPFLFLLFFLSLSYLGSELFLRLFNLQNMQHTKNISRKRNEIYTVSEGKILFEFLQKRDSFLCYQN